MTGFLIVDLFILFQHFNELIDAFRARRWFLGSMNSEQDRISIHAVERPKEGLCLFIFIQLCLKIFGNGRGLLRIIRRVPAAVLFAASMALSPAGFIFLPLKSFSAFSTLIFDQMLFDPRGVNF